jgi:hypothetical protein
LEADRGRALAECEAGVGAFLGAAAGAEVCGGFGELVGGGVGAFEVVLVGGMVIAP